MPPINYLNVYILALFGLIGTTIFGMFYFYGGMNDVSITISKAFETSTVYVNPYIYNWNLKGFIYCITFFIASVLFLAAIIIPSQDQIQQRMTLSTPYGTGQMQLRPGMAAPKAPPVQQQAPPMQQQAPPIQQQAPPAQQTPAPVKPAPSSKAKPEPTVSDIIEDESFDDINESFDDSSEDESAGDANVVYGSGKITDEAIVEFVNEHPDSAVKFLFRKSLEGKPLPTTEDEIYQVWQKRGLSRAKVREYILNLMEWDSLPEKPLHDIWSELRDQIFEVTH